MLFDTHAHYDDRKFDEDRDALLSSMKENGVGWVVNAGCGVESTKRGIALSEKYDFCYLTAGIHPNQAEDMNDGAFEEIKTEIENAVGSLIIGIEHVGSTSVEGMFAKPCIDIDVVIEDYSFFDDVVSKLSDIGYIHEGDLGIKGREAFDYTDKGHLMKHHLYVCPQDSEELRRHITFRDFLGDHPEAVERYSRVKEQAAVLFPNDIDGYIEYKSPVIKELYRECGL